MLDPATILAIISTIGTTIVMIVKVVFYVRNKKQDPNNPLNLKKV